MSSPWVARLADRRRSMRVADFDDRVSMVASGAHVGQPAYERQVAAIGHSHGRHRKVWEWCFMLEALEQRDLLRPGVRALGFGVGTEPLVAALAARGVAVVATDQPAAQAGAWDTSGQHAAELEACRHPDLCADAAFDQLVTFRPVDMRSIPADLIGFDVAWSSCCFEHLGSPDAGFDFVEASLATVKPGGIVVHTTEIDLDPGRKVLEIGSVDRGDYACFYRRRDLVHLVDRLRRAGHDVQCNFHASRQHPLERAVDAPPYTHDPHLRLLVGDHVVTSFGLTVTRGRSGL